MALVGVWDFVGSWEAKAGDVLAPSNGYFHSAPDISLRCSALRWEKTKDPSDIDRFPVTAKTWLQGESIQSALFEPPMDSGISAVQTEIVGDVASAVFIGGNEGAYRIIVTLTSSSGRVIQRSVKIKVREL